MDQPSIENTKDCAQDRLFSRISASPEAVQKFCKRWKIAELALFGSVLRDSFGQDSDIDVLVEFEPGGVPGIEYASMASELSQLFGRPADVLTRAAVERSTNFIRRREILESAEVIFTAKQCELARPACRIPKGGRVCKGC